MSNDKQYFKVAFEVHETVTWEGEALVEASTLAEAEAVLERNKGALMDRYKEGERTEDAAVMSTGELRPVAGEGVIDNGTLVQGVMALRDGEPVMTHSDSADFYELVESLK